MKMRGVCVWGVGVGWGWLGGWVWVWVYVGVWGECVCVFRFSQLV